MFKMSPHLANDRWSFLLHTFPQPRQGRCETRRFSDHRHTAIPLRFNSATEKYRHPISLVYEESTAIVLDLPRAFKTYHRQVYVVLEVVRVTSEILK